MAAAAPLDGPGPPSERALSRDARGQALAVQAYAGVDGGRKAGEGPTLVPPVQQHPQRPAGRLPFQSHLVPLVQCPGPEGPPPGYELQRVRPRARPTVPDDPRVRVAQVPPPRRRRRPDTGRDSDLHSPGDSEIGHVTR